MPRYSDVFGLAGFAAGVVAAVLILSSCMSNPEKTTLHLYLLAGQSNMAGRGVVGEVDTTVHPRVLALRADGSWGPAVEPVHFDKPNLIGVGPGFAFGRAMAEANPNVDIGLIPTAVGGSAIREWVPGAEHRDLEMYPYDDAAARVSLVRMREGGVLKGVIWHQGEADRNRPPEEYMADLVALIQRMRIEFGHDDLPFVAGELGYFFAARDSGAMRLNKVLPTLPDRINAVAVVSAAGLSDKGDSLHFDAASSRRLGERYAEAMLNLQAASGEP